MNDLKAGFARVNVTPMLGIHVAGYFKERIADGVLDELEINALALRAGENTLLLLSMDICHISTKRCEGFRKHIEEATGVPAGNILIYAYGPRHGALRHEGRYPRDQLAAAGPSV